tara:strand:+ start:175 stop:513 length:339 start_codon:yes stop_codon:yes gene_type:complete
MKMNYQTSHIVLMLVLTTALKKFFDHRKGETHHTYSDSGSYDNMTPLKHDIFKQLTLDMVAFLVIGMSSGAVFYNKNSFLDSQLGISLVSVAGYLTYYEVVEPYIANKLQKF